MSKCKLCGSDDCTALCNKTTSRDCTKDYVGLSISGVASEYQSFKCALEADFGNCWAIDNIDSDSIRLAQGFRHTYISPTTRKIIPIVLRENPELVRNIQHLCQTYLEEHKEITFNRMNEILQKESEG